MMGEYIIVFLVALVCLVTTSTCENDSKKSCELIHKEVSPFVKTKQGTDVLQADVHCDLTSQKSEVKLTFDINWALDTAEVDNNTLVIVTVVLYCWSSIELDFINAQNTANEKILLALFFDGECKVWTRNLSVFAKATNFRQMSLMGQKATWTSASAFTNITQGNNSFLNDLRVVTFRGSLPQNIRGLFNDTKIVWPNMIEIFIRGTPIKEIPEQWKITVPFLQVLYLKKCNLTEPPEFPWNNSTLDLAELREKYVYHYFIHYQVQSHLYPRILYLDKNNIEDLTSYEFRGFLHYVSLRENGLKVIGPSCFHNLEGIQTIDLGENNLTSLHQNLFQGLTSLLTIILGSNNLTVIERTLFKGLNSIKRIKLDHNKLHSIPNGLFNSLSTLELLSLSDNNIEKIEENPFPKDSTLQNLCLDKNELSSFPPWIFSLRKIKSIDLSSNQLTFEHFDKALDLILDYPLTGGKSSEIVLNLSNNNITTLVDYKALSKIKRNGRISPVQHAKYSYLWRAYKIILSGNPLVCDCIMSAVAQEIRKLFPTNSSMGSRFDTWRCHWPLELRNKSILEIGEDQWLETDLADRDCPKECTCRGSCSSGFRMIIVDCAGKNLTEVPSLMPQGPIELNLISNDIRDIPAYSFLANVTVLKLTNNKVERLKAPTVKKLKRLEILLIDSNRLTTLPREIKTLNFKTLALNQNFFKCDCTTKWIKHWLVQLKNKRRIKNIEKVFCSSEHALGQAIYSLPDGEFICATIQKKNTGKTINVETIASCALGGLLALILFVGIVLYKYHGEVKVFMYTHFNWHAYDGIDDSDPNKIYDAFLSFSGNDFDWVVNTLQERLENHEPPYKLCFHHRDFPIGVSIVENIYKSVDQSKRMLVVLSSSYAKSDWCLMEFREAHRKVLEDRMKYLIVILFDDVDITELEEEFKLYLRTNTYLSISDKRFWQKLFYAMPLPSARESVEDRSLKIVAASNNINKSAEISQQEEKEMAQNTADTIGQQSLST